jgi:hypothetical protein
MQNAANGSSQARIASKARTLCAELSLIEAMKMARPKSFRTHVAAGGNVPKVGRRARVQPNARPGSSASALPIESATPAT